LKKKRPELIMIDVPDYKRRLSGLLKKAFFQNAKNRIFLKGVSP